jgi:AcrR family transcriptional regulator
MQTPRQAPQVPEPGAVAALEPGRRGEILDAALAVFAEKGYTGGSMRDIAARVGVSEPAIYRYFPGKEALFLALVRVVALHLRDEASAILSAIRPETLRGQIAEALATRRRRIILAAPVLRTVLTSATRDEAVLAEIRSIAVAPVMLAVNAKVAELDAAFGIESDAESRRSRVRAFFALFVGTLATSVVLGDQPDDAMADAIVRIMGWEGRA